jgi:hypothetical protein
VTPLATLAANRVAYGLRGVPRGCGLRLDLLDGEGSREGEGEGVKHCDRLLRG